VQEVPCLSTTTSGSSSSTITNTSRHSGQNAILGFRELPTHHPTDIFGAIAIPSESIHSRGNEHIYMLFEKILFNNFPLKNVLLFMSLYYFELVDR